MINTGAQAPSGVTALRRQFLVIACALTAVAATLVGGCGMTQSELFSTGRDEIACESDASYYYLPKTVARIQVVKAEVPEGGDGSQKSSAYVLRKLELIRKADRAHRYCLSFRSNPAADETLIVEKTKNGLLARITSNSKDQSVAIARNISKAVFTAISQNPNFDPGLTQAGRSGEEVQPRLEDAFQGEFDPFNLAELAIVNDAIGAYGFCIVMERQGLGRRHASINEYCDRPLGHARREMVIQDAANLDNSLAGGIKQTRGVLYRPRVPYTMYLFRKRNMLVRGGWELRASEAVHLENRSPVLSVGVDRAFFASRKTTLNFDEGALTDINIDKTSEIAGFVTIPLTISQGIAALPANIVQVKIDNTNNNAQLLYAESKLIEAQKAYAETVASLTPNRAAQDVVGQQSGNDNRNGSLEPDKTASPSPDEHAAVTQVDIAQCVAENSKEWSSGEVQEYCGCLASCAKSGVSTLSSCQATCVPR